MERPIELQPIQFYIQPQPIDDTYQLIKPIRVKLGRTTRNNSPVVPLEYSFRNVINFIGESGVDIEDAAKNMLSRLKNLYVQYLDLDDENLQSTVLNPGFVRDQRSIIRSELIHIIGEIQPDSEDIE